MIRKEEVYKIGIFNKPHGVRGELLFTFTDDIFDRVEDCDYVVCPIDGILVPFFISEYRFKSDTTALMTLEDVDTVEKARMFTNVEVYFPLKYVDDEEISQLDKPYLIGFKAKDKKYGEIGKIIDIDDTTSNLLFTIENAQGEQFYVPAHEELITKIDNKKRLITFDLPEGLLTMNHEEGDERE